MQKKETDLQNETETRRLKEKEEATKKRNIAKLTRERNPDLKELDHKKE